MSVTSSTPTRAHGTLAVRIALLTTAAALITAVIAGGIAFRLIREANESGAQASLGRIADAAQSDVTAGQLPRIARATLRSLEIQTGVIGPGGVVTTDSAAVRDALTPAEIQSVLAGGSISAAQTVDGQSVLVEARPIPTGGLILLQRRADATALGNQAIRRVLFALLIAVGLATLLGIWAAIRLARPLRRAADAAHALAGGRRDVVVATEGPREIAEVGDALNTLVANLSHSEARQREFLLSVSHDLRTPLTAISGYAESLADGMISPDQTRQVGAVMLSEAQRLNRLVGDLRDLGRLDAKDFRIDLSSVDIAALLKSTAQVWASRCMAEGIPFSLERPPGARFIWTDPTRLRQVLDGLLENALRVTPAGRPIVLAARTESTWSATPGDGPLLTVLEVRDGGPGLTDDDIAVAFARSALYERYRGIRQVGTGLGLAIVDRLVARLGGTVEAGHAVEGGARFTVRLPDQPQVSAAPPAYPPRPYAPDPQAAGSGFRTQP
jgi:two-component system, OmpR family, sensor kinase